MSLLWPITAIIKSRGKQDEKIRGVCEVEERGLYHNSVHRPPKREVEIGNWVGVEMAFPDSKNEAATNHVLLAEEKENQCGLASYTTGVGMCVRNCVRHVAKRETIWEELGQNVCACARICTSLVTPYPFHPSLHPTNKLRNHRPNIPWKHPREPNPYPMKSIEVQPSYAVQYPMLTI